MDTNLFFQSLEALTGLFILAIGLGVLAVIWMYIVDRLQKEHAVRRNYPVIGRFRYLFENIGEFFRQYFFAMDREEMPFNRAERTWVYRASKHIDSTQAFGSTHNPRPVGSIIFVNSMVPVLAKDAKPAAELTIGAACKTPYTTRSFFNISGMSYGALSRPAVLALSNGARMAGCLMNTGEGGLSPYHLEGGADLVFQIGTAKYGVRDEAGKLSGAKLKAVAAHEQVRMIEIKLSQGAKPGKGGILPAAKVTEEIARIRHIKAGEPSISPNRHPEINNIDDLLDFVAKVRDLTGKPVGFKLVMGEIGWMRELCETLLKRGVDYAPDFITVDSGDGGSGAAPRTLMDYVGLNLIESLPQVVDLLIESDLRDRIKVACSGKLINPVGVAWALAVGADFVNSARGFMFSLGCIQALKCHLDECPTGITTHRKSLQRGLDPKSKAVRVCNYAQSMTHEVEMLAHSCGVTEPRQLARKHARVVVEDGLSVGLEDLYKRHWAA